MSTVERRTRSDRTQRESLLKAATQEFLRHGYHKTSITAIVSKVGGSTRNIYDYFTDKHGLLLAVLEYNSTQMVKGFIDIDPVNRTTADYLQGFAKGYLTTILHPQSMGFYRLVISEAPRMPELARVIMRSAQQVVTTKIASYLQQQMDLGTMKARDAGEAAEMFIALIRDKPLMRATLAPSRKMSEAELDAFVKSAVSLYLEGMLTPSVSTGAKLVGRNGRRPRSRS